MLVLGRYERRNYMNEKFEVHLENAMIKDRWDEGIV
jgi:hypothetical protein